MAKNRKSLVDRRKTRWRLNPSTAKVNIISTTELDKEVFQLNTEVFFLSNIVNCLAQRSRRLFIFN